VAGSYVLRARQGDATAEEPVSVRSSDVEGIALALMPPVDIPVITRFAGKPNAQPARNDLIDDNTNGPGGCVTQIRPLSKAPDPLYSFGKAAEESGDGTVIRGVAPGKYRVSIQCFGGYARSAVSGTHDLASDPILTIEPGVSPPAIEINVSTGGGSIKGKLMFDGLSATVLLMPQFSAVAGPQASGLFRENRADPFLEFQFGGLPPGAYIAWAFAGQNIEYGNPDFLRALSGGVVVQIEGDGEKEITIDRVIE
jgi:hypothetical protein